MSTLFSLRDDMNIILDGITITMLPYNTISFGKQLFRSKKPNLKMVWNTSYLLSLSLSAISNTSELAGVSASLFQFFKHIN